MLWPLTTAIRSLRFNLRKLRRLKIGKPYPFSDMLIAFEGGQVGAV